MLLYLVTVREFASAEVGLILTVGGVIAVAFSVPLGHFGNGSKARTAATISLAVQGLATTAYVFVPNFAGLLAVACAYSLAESASTSSRAVLVAGLAPSSQRTAVRARLRAVTNAGSAVGAGVASLTMAADSDAVWTVAMMANGVCLLAGGVTILAAVPKTPEVAAPARARRWAVLYDRRYAALSAVNVLLVMNAGILTVGLPVWFATALDTPKSVFGVLVIANTVMVVLLQTRFARGVTDTQTALRGFRWCGLLLAGCCLVFATSDAVSGWWSILALAIGVVIHGAGEMIYSAASWQLSYDLAPDHAQGQYQGMFTMSSQLGMSMAPFFLAAFISGLGVTGWFAVATVMVAAGLLAAPLIGQDREALPTADDHGEQVVVA
jgi:MFS family permease